MPLGDCRTPLLPLLAYINEDGAHLSEFRIACDGDEAGLALCSLSLETKLLCIMVVCLDSAFKLCQGGVSCMANYSLHCYES